MSAFNVLDKGNRSGFSLFESLVAMAISMVIGGAIVTLLVSQTQLSATQNRHILTQEELRDTIRFMVDEISLAGSGVSEPSVLTASSHTFMFVGNIDGEGAWEKVRYSLDEGRFKRTLWQSSDQGTTWTLISSDVVLRGVASLNFDYFGAGNSIPATVDKITAVQIQITTNPSSRTTAITSGKIAAQSMVNRATIRNRLI